jgi:hypothetical protein
MQHMVLGAPTSGKCEDSKKREKKFVNETLLLTLEFEGDLHVNEVTWFELAHQYLVTLVEVKTNGDLIGLRPEECIRLIECLQGDGGVLFGAIVMVVAIESDVQV